VPRSAGSPDWREVTVVEMAAGRAVRVRGVSTTRSTDGTVELAMVSMHTLIPVPGGEGGLNIVLTSPQTSLADPLMDLFDAISSTLAWEAGPPAR
jgi:hypothetical protein